MPSTTQPSFSVSSIPQPSHNTPVILQAPFLSASFKPIRSPTYFNTSLLSSSPRPLSSANKLQFHTAPTTLQYFLYTWKLPKLYVVAFMCTKCTLRVCIFSFPCLKRAFSCVLQLSHKVFLKIKYKISDVIYVSERVCVWGGGEYASHHRNARLRFINLCSRMPQIPSSHPSKSVKAHCVLFTTNKCNQPRIQN